MDIVPRKQRFKAIYQTRVNTEEQRRRWIDRQMFAQAYHKKLHETGQNKCAVCGWTPPPYLFLYSVRGNVPSIIELHHLIPVSAGGKDTEENVVPLCPNHHRIADLLNGMSDIGGRQVTGITDKETLLRFLSLLDTNPEACADEILEKKLQQQADITELLSDILSER